jgi:hypothetical protein
MRQSHTIGDCLNIVTLALAISLFAAGCSAAPTRDPYETQPIPEGARFEGKCTFIGEIGCSLASLFSSDAGYERRPACIAFIEPNGTKVEQCGSVSGNKTLP